MPSKTDPVVTAPVSLRAFVVEEQFNPSSDFFVIPALENLGFTITRLNFAQRPSRAELVGAVLVLVRYVPPAWVKLIEATRPLLRELVFFMDDDVLDRKAARDQPWRYQLKLRRLAASRKRWLHRQKARLWVSTPYLQQKYAHWQPKLILPSAVPAQINLRRLFYHGSASHQQDIRWLQPIVAEALKQDERLVFEIIGGHEVAKLYKQLPRTSIVQPLKWPAYQAMTSLQNYHIGLNPLHDAPFNRARSHTKFFDITRFGAVGIYSPASACAEVIGNDEAGLVVELDADAWVEAILRLTNDEILRLKLLTNAQRKLSELLMTAQASYSQLF